MPFRIGPRTAEDSRTDSGRESSTVNVQSLGRRALIVTAIGAATVGVVWWSAFRFGPGESAETDDSGNIAATDVAIGAADEPQILRLDARGRRNLGLQVGPVARSTYWKKLEIPAVVIEPPGLAVRGITAPAAGIVTTIHVSVGDAVPPGTPLFTLHLVGESLQLAQTEYLQATREAEILRRERARLQEAVDDGAIPARRIIELDQEIDRQTALASARRQDLLARGLSLEQVERIGQGEFVATITIEAPRIDASANIDSTDREAPVESNDASAAVPSPDSSSSSTERFFEVRELAVAVGRQVQGGEALAVLADHESLLVQGHAFRREAAAIERAVAERRPVELEFDGAIGEDWPAVDQPYLIRNLGNEIDPESRTFDVIVPLPNPSRLYEDGGRTYLVRRYRPGQRARMRIPVERLDDVIVLPAEAVVRDGPSSYVFRQNGDLFSRIPVRVLHQDRRDVVIEREQGLGPGSFVALDSAAALDRILASQTQSGMPADVHVHADGTVHAAH